MKELERRRHFLLLGRRFNRSAALVLFLFILRVAEHRPEQQLGATAFAERRLLATNLLAPGPDEEAGTSGRAFEGLAAQIAFVDRRRRRFAVRVFGSILQHWQDG